MTHDPQLTRRRETLWRSGVTHHPLPPIPPKALPFAKALAERVGKLQKAFFRGKISVRLKDARNWVTDIDTRCEKIIIAEIQKKFPDHGYLAEEGSFREKDFMWIVDPLDGTTNFARGIPVFCVSIALAYRGIPLVGVIYEPLLDQLFYAQKGEGAFLNRSRIHVSSIPKIGDSLITTGFPYTLKKNRQRMFDTFKKAVSRTFALRRGGSVAIDLAYIAAGITDGHYEIALNPWDVAAGILLVLEAGGKATLPNGRLFEVKKDFLIVSNGKIHAQLLKIVG